ncbi:hypothetical protein VP468E531_P0086 [Vibrio phage 468E53-1]|nr:hypothetical protein VP468E531_P0086 [Vibrio phage 468E53-1]
MTTKVNNRMIDGASLSVLDFGAVGDGIADDYQAFQDCALECLLREKSMYIPEATYLIGQRVILPFANSQGDLSCKIIGNKARLISGVAQENVSGSTHGCFVTGRYDGSALIPVTSGEEEYLTGNLSIEDLVIENFGEALRMHNAVYGSSLKNLYFNKCFNPIYLSRCFYLEQSNILMRGFVPALPASVGYRSLSFSNSMPASGIKVIGYERGFVLGGFDGGTIRDSTAESCDVGVDLAQESNMVTLDTMYLENNTTNIRFAAVIRRLTISGSWLFGDGTNHFSSLLGNSDYTNLTLINNRIWGGIVNTPSIRNVFGEAIQCGDAGEPTNDMSMSGLPNVVRSFKSYGFTTTTSGYNSTVRCLDNAQESNLIPASWSGGRFRNGRDSDDRSPFQSVIDNGGSLEFTTSYDFDGNSMFHYSVNVAHSVGTFKVNALIMYDNETDSYRAMQPTVGGLIESTDLVVDNNDGKVRIKLPVFTTPSLDYSIVRIV